ncbi:MAG: nuclear transport factor 2 family protein [Calditrichaeota bacterium]|nr:MAG: nuclear transport factor 2 family protein [Calditrichota bacterium]
MRTIPVIISAAILVFGSMLCQQVNLKKHNILKVDEDFQLAKINNDTLSLDKILAEEFSEMNQYGVKRNKAKMKELFSYFKLQSLKTDSSKVEFANGTAVVTGSQREINPIGEEFMFFQRVYIYRAGRWQLFASIQFLDPNRMAGN